MVARIVLSNRFGICLIGFWLLCLVASMHDHEGSSPREEAVALGSTAVLAAWTGAVFLAWLKTRGRNK